MRPRKDCARYDVLAVVFPDSIVYFTDLPELSGLIAGSEPAASESAVG